ncbi:DUF3019 domain-containing protein [Aliikangiella maris]|uniref:DUF3019 domain-containing protein n=2 Tax=Aliikangiella maris TaxID=3162458 RepID=A0ABV2BR96_9GAMM
MFFSSSNKLLNIGLLLLLAIISAELQAAEKLKNANEPQSISKTTLDIMPKKCVALRKGRECFARINVYWQVTQAGNYCLRRQVDKMIINCWQAEISGEFAYIFRSKNPEVLELISQESQKKIISASISVGWVYQSRKRKGRWRVF